MSTTVQTPIYTTVNSTVTVICTLSVFKPSWSGPPLNEGSPTYYNGDNDDKINPLFPRLRFAADNKNLMIAGIQREDEGTYRCESTRATGGPINTSVQVRVLPSLPDITNPKETLSQNRVVVRGTQGTSLELVCISRGGYPEQDVAWYREGTQLTPTEDTSVRDTATDTYTVTKRYRFTPQQIDDKKTFSCQSWFRTGPGERQTTSVLLYLNLQPSLPTTSKLNSPRDGVEVIIGQCESSGFRPGSSFTMTMVFGTRTHTYTGSPIENPGTETYSVLQQFPAFIPKKVDNGLSLTCTVGHDTLGVQKLTNSVEISVQFAPVTVQLNGNREVIATGSNQLTLTCISGESNPASEIVWYNGSTRITSSQSPSNTEGPNKGIIRSQQLVLNPTREMNGDTIICSVSNSISSSAVTNSVVLNLKYHPMVTITPTASVTIMEGQSNPPQITCTVDSSPTSNITWRHGGTALVSANPSNGILVHSLSAVRQSYGTYTCRADNTISPYDQKDIMVLVKFRPLNATLTGNKVIVASGQNPLTMTCTAGNSNPVSTIQWTYNSINYDQPTTSINGDYGGRIASSSFTLTPTRIDDGKVVMCSASNNVSSTSPASAYVTLDLHYSPLLSDIPDQTAVEGTTITLPCAAHSKPPARFTWNRKGNSDVVFTSNGTYGSNQGPYTLQSVRRSHSGTYTCTANNNVGNNDAKDVRFIVQFPPDVTVITQNTSSSSKSAYLHCKASGVPMNYSYRQQWTQEWPGFGPVRDQTGGENLTLDELSYAHSGVYTCSASNGIKVYGTDTHFMNGSGYLLVTDRPVITSPVLGTGLTHSVATALGKNASVNIQVFSNGGSVNTKVYTVVNGTRTTTLVGTYNISSTVVQLPVFTHMIPTKGDLIEISVLMKQENDFGYYDVVLLNDVGDRSLRINIDPEGPPQAPNKVKVLNEKHNSAEVSWFPGFNGGFQQTFVIQTSIDGAHWRNVSLIDGGTHSNESPFNMTLSELEPETLYWIRLFSYNIKGTSDYSVANNVTTSKAPDITKDSSTSGALIGGAVGGSVAAIIIVVIVVVVVLRKHQGGLKKNNDGFHRGLSKTDKDQNDEIPDEVKNPMYISAGDMGGASSTSPVEYASPVKKPIKSAAGKGDVYSTVDLTKKTKKKTEAVYADVKKDKGKKTKDKKSKKDEYENPHAGASKTTYDNKAFEENLYENNQSAKTGKNVSPDGLIYADLDFPNPPKGQKRLVIHGLDDKTEYAEVDLTRTADPLPDSDTEDKKKPDTKP